jgi:hypothetical protein
MGRGEGLSLGCQTARRKAQRFTRGLTETDQGRSIVSGSMIKGGAFGFFAAARSRRTMAGHLAGDVRVTHGYRIMARMASPASRCGL